ncbi:LOW QUALITY PROTEIN: transient-receptor-potential-like protein [Cylas formicarius]|uniref:LOW QUALITY PROTEIN: transient-receptor-potential-like protein n=1 Tax=Cylas formicarius TaxID=197179 RepID=UPI002958667A|nr:LOW QUALITY PROTEIN: transient-receptor-potential-like protein [Cylas formicarius]
MGTQSDEEDVENKITRKNIIMPNLPKTLSLEEKKYLLAIERGDLGNVRRLLQKVQRKKTFDINCMDSLGRGALSIAIDQENLEMVELLVVMGVETRDALLHAINVEFVEAVELLLEHEELIHQEAEPYSWQKVDINTAMFTPDITPLILAAHRNNYEILKILLDRGASIPMPHDVKCGCDECIRESEKDSLRHSLSRLNEYRALASPSLIALSSSDPLLTAFQLSWELRNLAAFAEPECKSEYMDLRRQCQQFAVDLLHQSRSSQELAIILNHDPDNSAIEEGEHMKFARLELAIMYKQKKFVAHPNIQQLLAAFWYEGVPGFRRKSSMNKILIIVRVALLFPFYCMLYMLAPETKTGKLMRKPFMKFLIHASSYLFFLLLLILVSLRAEDLFFEFFGSESMKAFVIEKKAKQRGNYPTILEYAVLIYVVSFIVEETQEIFTEGIKSYLRNLWNFIDFTRNLFYTMTFGLRVIAYIQQANEIRHDPNTAYFRREQWNAFDPQLIAEGLFAAANILSALKLVHLFSINPHLGPLQISLGRMVIDIVKFFFIYSLVLFAFACGLNQLLWYFSDLERQKCYHLPSGDPDFDNAGDSCMKWRRFANVFESSQSLFWASFGMIDLASFELTGIKTYTRFWGLLMFGSYSVINVIVLLNLLIAMMSNSYAMIEEHSDTEWKFARTKLWLSYFDESGTLPPPFNIFPKPKNFLKLLGIRKKDRMRRMSTKRRNREEKERDYRYTAVMRALVWRYVSAMHRKCDESEVTEDDVNELKSDISSFRYEILEVLNRNGMDISSAEIKEKAVLGKKMKVWERRLLKDFKVAPVAAEENEDIFAPPPDNESSLARFRRIARMAALDSNLNKWKAVVKGACIASQIGRCHSRDSFKKQQNLQKAMAQARKLAEKTPESSRATTPLVLPDFTGEELVKLVTEDETSHAKPAKKTVTLNPNVAMIRGQGPPLSPTISVIPPQSPVPEQSPSAANDVDLINLESSENSPIASKKEGASSTQPPVEVIPDVPPSPKKDILEIQESAPTGEDDSKNEDTFEWEKSAKDSVEADQQLSDKNSFSSNEKLADSEDGSIYDELNRIISSDDGGVSSKDEDSADFDGIIEKEKSDDDGEEIVPLKDDIGLGDIPIACEEPGSPPKRPPIPQPSGHGSPPTVSPPARKETLLLSPEDVPSQQAETHLLVVDKPPSPPRSASPLMRKNVQRVGTKPFGQPSYGWL